MAITIGCDPDSNKSGIAVYESGTLTKLKSMSLIEVIGLFRELEHKNPKLHIEDLCANRCSSFSWKPSDNDKVRAKKSENVGMCKQAQKEIERAAAYYGIEVFRHKVSKDWKSQEEKPVFTQITKWIGPSNEDTRSAAYFGFLGLK